MTGISESQKSIKSLPSRGRGLKCSMYVKHLSVNRVAPLAGAWIEIILFPSISIDITEVAPLAGAWIEILHNPPLNH